ncbi:uncharacterized protein K460DRAFT_428436 [Cucurbitaria berberidis CBS 394.84]|uniref:Uncharacterized protein n=1 Tax=Cucurbitaria berberidis CBS 394.84 TaxID=1168544 RepID=A0A9P4GM98_9PLEO|nr:uncharacterized protein K460DRAFT_428436 [Cucurbitaria berberidis CBS 394.84]KAF1849003.1 hypothetical protein K460DRAFT_428436 [Cucurbitaria berberidis CBS 394.84]
MFTSTGNAIDLVSNEHTDNKPQLLSSMYKGEMFATPPDSEMSPWQHIPMWTLDEVGYTYDAPHVQPDGRMEGGLHSPTYYAYSPNTNSWEDGLQEIESFDWSGKKSPEPPGDTQEENCQHGCNLQARDYTTGYNPEDSLLDARMHHQQQPLVNTETSDHVQGMSTGPHSTERTSEPAKSDASYLVTDSPIRIPRLPREDIEISPTTISTSQIQLRSASPQPNNKRANGIDGANIDVALAIAEPNNPTVGPKDVRTPASQEYEDASFGEHQAQDVGFATEKANVDDVQEVEDTTGIAKNAERMSFTRSFSRQSTSSCHELVLREPQPAASSHLLSTQLFLDTKRSDEGTPEPEDLCELGSFDMSSLSREVGSVLSTMQMDVTYGDKENEIASQPSKIHNTPPRHDSVAHIQPFFPVQEDSREHDAPSFHADSAVSMEAIIEEPTGSLPVELISALVDSPSLDPGHRWREQLQDVIAETSPGDYSDLRPEGYIDHDNFAYPASPSNPVESLLAKDSPPSQGASSTRQIDIIQELPPSPFEFGVDTSYEEVALDRKSKESLLGISKDTQNIPENIAVSSQSLHVELLIGNESAQETSVDDQKISSEVSPIIETPNSLLPSSKMETGATVDCDQSSTSEPTSEAKTADTRKRLAPPHISEVATDTEEDMPARKKQRINTPAESHNAVTAPATNTKLDMSTSINEGSDAKGVQTLEEPQHHRQQTTSRFDHFAVGKYSRQPQEPTSTSIQGVAGEPSVDRTLGLQQPDYNDNVDMPEHYSDADVPVTPAPHASTAASNLTPSKSRARNPVSPFEVFNLNDNTAREDSRNRRKNRDISTVPGPHLVLHLDPNEPRSSVKAVEGPLAVDNADDPFMLVEKSTSDAVPTIETDISSMAPTEPKKRPSAVIIRKIPGPAPKKGKSATAKRAGKGRKAISVNNEKEEQPQELVSAAKIEFGKPTDDVTISAPPKIKAEQAKKVAKGSKRNDHNDQGLPSIDHTHPLYVGYGKRHTRGDTKFEEQVSSSSKTTSTGSFTKEHVGDGHDDEDEDWSHAAITKAKAKAKTKGNATPLLLSTKAPKPSASRVGTPATNMVSTSSTPRANKYGFSPLRGKRIASSRKSTDTAAAAAPNATAPKQSKPAPKPKPAAKGKAKKSEGDIPVPTNDVVVVEKPKTKKKAAVEPSATDQATRIESDRRTTRRASAMEEEVRQKEGNVKLRLRCRNTNASAEEK